MLAKFLLVYVSYIPISATVREGKWQVDRVVLKFNNTTEELCLLEQN